MLNVNIEGDTPFTVFGCWSFCVTRCFIVSAGGHNNVPPNDEADYF